MQQWPKRYAKNPINAFQMQGTPSAALDQQV
jgi:hypothetical protein